MELALNPITIGLRGIGGQLRGLPSPVLDLDFAGTKTLDPRITFTRASNATYFDANGVLQTAASGVARFDHNPTTLQSLGLLVEEQRTNSIRNNTMQGAVAGTPGTLPTNWGWSTGGSATYEVVGVGTESGITYIDIRFQGSSSADLWNLNFESTTQIVAANGQTWAGSVYIKIVAGSLTNLPLVQRMVFRTAAGGAVTANDVAITSTTANLNSQRFSNVFAASGATIERVTNALNSATPLGAFDVTLRIGLPQLEQGAFATSVIPTTTAAATRNADAASMTGTNFSSWYRADEGTLYVDYINSTTVTGSLFATDDKSVNNRIIAYTNAGTNPAMRVVSGGVDQVNTNIAVVSANTPAKISFAYKVNDFAGSVNGATVVTDTSGIVPSGQNTARIGTNVVTAAALNGTIKKIAFYPTRLSNAQLQALTR
jgi:hypothetical protein